MEVVKNIRNERILFSPLNWGWGHVSRSIPLIKNLLIQNNEIIIACDAEQQSVYQEYLEGVKYEIWKGYPFKFNGKGNFGLDFLLSFKKLFSFGKQESKSLERLVEKENITFVVSDHRYFFRSKKVRSVFVTHQFNLPTPWYLIPAKVIHKRFMEQFDEIWIVDNEKNSFSGKLGRVRELRSQKIHFLGPLSRFRKDQNFDKKWITVLVSGPEPYAQQFYESQKKKVDVFPENLCIIYNGFCEDTTGKTSISWMEIDQRLKETKKLISRSGYSSIMDAYFLGCETEWFATPGQWEQEYLKEFHSTNG